MSWLKLERGELVNLDHIAVVEIMDMTPAPKSGNEIHHVIMHPANPDSVPFKACKGSRSKCEDYLRALLEFVGGKKICAIGEHQCQCECGCKTKIIEGFTLCGDCADGFHSGNKELVNAGLKKDAA